MQRVIIFDCDGVLVDSEPIASKITAESLKERGLPISEEDVRTRFTGISMNSLAEMIAKEYGDTLPDELMGQIEQKTLEAFDMALTPMLGVEAALQNLDAEKCVASSSSPRRIAHSLDKTGLAPYFKHDHIFSAQLVKRGKPFPDLFLHAAEKLKVTPQDCVVVEDSIPGVKAGRAAGMLVLGFTGATHANTPQHRANLEEAGADLVFDDMHRLPHLLRG